MRKDDITCGKFMRSRASVLLFFLCGMALYAQNPPPPDAAYFAGSPFIRNYPPDEYGAHNQNWAIVQDARGVMYFGNSRGLLEYDGVSWRLIETGTPRIIRSLAISADNRIFAGGYGELGYLAPDETQQLQYVSLLPKVEMQYRDFTDVRQALSGPEGVYFLSSKYLFLWDGQKMQVWPAQTAFQAGLRLESRVFVQQEAVGLMEMVSGSLRPAPQGEKLAGMQVRAMASFSDQGNPGILIATLDQGLFRYDGAALSTFATEADERLIQGQVFCATAMTEGRFALGTRKDGVIVIDLMGKILQSLNKPTGLQDEAVLALFEDRQRGLWMGLQVGIARAETGSPISVFGNQEGIEGSVWEMVRHHGRLYAASIMGLFYIEDNKAGGAGNARRFKPVHSVAPQCWALLPWRNTLLAGTFGGIYEVSGNQGRRISDGFVFSLHRSQQDTNRVFVGMQKG